MKELRSYIFVVLGKLVKISHELNRKSPHLKSHIINAMIEEIGDVIRKIIQKNHKSIDEREVKQIWAEVEFYERFTVKFRCKSIEKCYHNLRKIWSKRKGLSKLVSESEIFSKELKSAKENLISTELNKAKMMQSCLE